MEKYTKKCHGNNIILTDNLNNTKLIVIHNDDDYIFDTIFIDEKYDFNFISYIVKELKKTKDIAVLFALYDSVKLEKLLYENDFKVSNYQYTIESKNYINNNDYDISHNLDEESKKYYLKTINKLSMINHKYFNPTKEYFEYGNGWFENNKYIYRIYRKNGVIVGIVDYELFDNDPNYGQPTNEVFNYNNKLCIRCLFGENKDILEDILKDLLNTYKKDIVINITYTENNLRDVVHKLNGKFNYCQYTLICN